VVTGVIVIVVLAVLAIVSGATASKTVSVAEAASGAYNNIKIQVTGKVVDNSYAIDGNVLSFSIRDEEAVEEERAGSSAAAGAAGAGGGAAAGSGATGAAAGAGGGVAASSSAAATAAPQLRVVYDRGVSATFGNQVTAICTGTIGADGVLVCTELVTKCPSKYESSTSALSVARLLSYGEQILDKPVKLAGTIKADSIGPVGRDSRFVLIDQEAGEELPVAFDGALPDELREGSEIVLTGSLNAAGRFAATDLALSSAGQAPAARVAAAVPIAPAIAPAAAIAPPAPAPPAASFQTAAAQAPTKG
jgi:cytochrome c-type biogenesis protein CcmE